MEKTKQERPFISEHLSDLPHRPIESLEHFQGDLKDLTEREYNKLKKSLIENGIIVPFFVWHEEDKLLDGHQRKRVMINEGWITDVPVVYISADDEEDAKKKLLVITSQYGKITQEGFDEFAVNLGDDWVLESINLDALPIMFSDFNGDGINLDDFFTTTEEGSEDPKGVITLRYSLEDSERVLSAFEAMEGTRESIVWELLGLKWKRPL